MKTIFNSLYIIWIVWNNADWLVKRIDLYFDIDGVLVKPSSSVCNLGVLFDSSSSFGFHLAAIVKSSFYHLRNIAHLRSSLSLADAETVVHELITSRLD